MIRQFKSGDQLRLKPNEFSDYSDCEFMLERDEYKKYTLEEGEDVLAIIIWFESSPHTFGACILTSGEMNIGHIRQLKLFIDNAIITEGSKLLITYSVDCDVLNRWHKFLGFQIDRSDRRFIEGKFFNKWVKHGN